MRVARGLTWLFRFAWPLAVHGFAVNCADIPYFFDCLTAEGVRELVREAPRNPSLTSFTGMRWHSLATVHRAGRKIPTIGRQVRSTTLAR